MRIEAGKIRADWGARWFFARGRSRFYFTLGIGWLWVTVYR